MRDGAHRCDGIHYVFFIDDGAHWGLHYGALHVSETAPTTGGIGPIVVSEMEDDGAHQSWHEVSTAMPASVDSPLLFSVALRAAVWIGPHHRR